MSRSRQNRCRAAARTAPDKDAGCVSHAAAAPTPILVPDTRAGRLAAAPGAVAAPVAIGVGIDTSRYGHYATFLDADLQPAAPDLKFVESAQGYQQLRERLAAIVKKHGPVHFHFRLDVAGRYADNLLAFLHGLPEPRTISCGDPQRNKNYRAAIFGHKKSDAAESTAAARFALTEKPKPMPVAAPAVHQLCQIASRLESQIRQCTRLINQLHNLLARAFPELALLVKDLSAGWVLALLDRYPTAAKLAAAHASSLEKIRYLPHEHISALLEQARTSVASLTGPVAEELVRDLAGQLKDAHVRHKALEKLLVSAYRQLPEPNHLDTIIGFGEVTAAILTAKMISHDRFVEPGKLPGTDQRQSPRTHGGREDLAANDPRPGEDSGTEKCNQCTQHQQHELGSRRSVERNQHSRDQAVAQKRFPPPDAVGYPSKAGVSGKHPAQIKHHQKRGHAKHSEPTPTLRDRKRQIRRQPREQSPIGE